MGKTSVAGTLAKAINAQVLNVKKLILRKRLFSRLDESRGSYVIDMGLLKQALRKELARKGAEKAHVVIDTIHVASLDPEQVDYVIVLRCDPLLLMNRLRERSDRRKMAENVISEFLDCLLIEALDNFPRDRVLEVDTTCRAPREVVEFVLRSIKRAASPPRSKTINWSSRFRFVSRLTRFPQDRRMERI